MSKQKLEYCRRCQESTNGGISRRDNKSPLCTKCEELEAFIDMAETLTYPLIKWEFKFQQLLAPQNGMDIFESFLKFRKSIGKKDPSFAEIHYLIWDDMFGCKDKKGWMRQLGKIYADKEKAWKI